MSREREQTGAGSDAHRGARKPTRGRHESVPPFDDCRARTAAQKAIATGPRTLRTGAFSAVIVLLLASGMVLAQPASVTPVGFLLSVRGAVALKRRGASAAVASYMMLVRPGDTLRLGAGAGAELLLYQGGRRFRLPAPAEVRVTADQVAVGGKALSPTGAPLPTVVADARPTARLMGLVVRAGGGSGYGPRALSPEGAVPEAGAALHWEGPIRAQASELLLRVYLPGQDPVIQTHLKPSERDFGLPAGKCALGKLYIWSVAALADDGSPLDQAGGVLRLLPPAEQTVLGALETQAQQERESDPASPATRVALFQQQLNSLRLRAARETADGLIAAFPTDRALHRALQGAIEQVHKSVGLPAADGKRAGG